MHSFQKCTYLLLFFFMLGGLISATAQNISSNIQIITFKPVTTCSGSYHFDFKTQPGSGYWTAKKNTAVFSPDSSSYNVTVSGLKQNDTTIVEWLFSPVSGPPFIERYKIAYYNTSIANITTKSNQNNDGICSTTDTLKAAKVVNGIGTWSSSNSNVKFSNSNSEITVVSNLPNGKSDIKWNIIYSGCPSSTDYDTIINKLPSKAFAGNDTTVCSTRVDLNARKPQFGVGQWSGDDHITFDNPRSTTAQASNLKEGVNYLIWSVYNGGCPSFSSDTVIIRNGIPSRARIIPLTPTSDICSDSITIFAARPTQGSGRWFTKTNSTILIEPQENNSAILRNLAAGINYIYWQVETLGTRCQATIDSISIKNNQPSNARIITPDTIVCQKTVSLRAIQPAQGKGEWYHLVNSGNNPASQTLLTNQTNYTYSQLGEDTSYFKWSVSFGGCPASEKIVKVINELPQRLTAGDDRIVCSNSTIMNAQEPRKGYNAVWRLGNINSSTRFDTITKGKAQVFNLSYGDNYFIWKVSRDGSLCPAVYDTVIINNDLPLPFDAGEDREFCGTSIDLKPMQLNNNFNNISATWSIERKPAKIKEIKFDPTSTFQKIDELNRSGKYTFRLTLKTSACSVFDTVSYYRIQFDTVFANASANTCFSTDDLKGTNPTVEFPGTGKSLWRILKDPQTNGLKAEIENPTNYNARIKNMVTTEVTYEVVYAIYNKTCDYLYDTVKILRNKVVFGDIADSDITTCKDTVNLVAAIPPQGTGIWINVNSPKVKYVNPLIGHIAYATDLNIYSDSIANPDDTRTYFNWIVSNGECQNSVRTVTVKRYLPPNAFEIKENSIEVCENNSFVLTVHKPKLNTGYGAWYFNGTKISADTSISSATISGLKYGKNNFIWKVTNGPDNVCKAQQDTIVVTKYLAVPKPELNLTDTSLCSNNANIIVVNNFNQANSSWKSLEDTSSLKIIYTNNKKYNISGFNAGRNRIVYHVQNGLCANSDTAVFTLNKPPAQAIIITRDTSFCFSESSAEFPIKAVAPTNGDKGYWINLSGSQNFKPSWQDNNASSTIVKGFNELVWRTENSTATCVLSDTLRINLNSLPRSVNAGLDAVTHEDEKSLIAQPLEPGLAGMWKSINNNAVIAENDNPRTLARNLVLGKNTFVWSVSNLCGSVNDTVVIERILFKIPSGLSPNGDGKNDKFFINGVEKYEPRELTIFNRWGTEVYKSEKYDNNWEGTAKNGDILDEDTYYYVLKIVSEEKHEHIKTGFVVLKRE